MQTAIDFIGMTCLLLVGIVFMLGLGIVIAYECRMINRLMKPELPVENVYGQSVSYWPATPLYPEGNRGKQELS